MKVNFIILILVTFCLSLQGQEKLDLSKIPTVWMSDTLKLADTTDLIFETISEKEFYAHYKIPPQADSTTQRNPSEPQIIKTKNATYLIDTVHTYNSSYNYFGFIPELDCHYIGFCGSGTCNDYLLDNATNTKMSFSASFDAGVLAFILSPSNDFLLISSSYDGPDYEDYYDFRAEILIYKIEKGKGISGIKPYRFFATQDWSIEDVLWVNDDSIVLKIYEGQRMNGEGEHTYLKSKVK